MLRRLITAIKKIPYSTLPIIFVMGVIPLIVRCYVFEAHLSMMSWYVSNDQTDDMYNYYKSEFLVATAGVMVLVILAGVIFSKKFEFNKIFIPLGVYAVFVVASTVCSDYKYFCLNGMDNHFETVYVLLTYCLLSLFCYWFVTTKGSLKFVLYAWLIGIALMGVIGLFQITGNDLSATEFGKFLILPEELRADHDIVFNFNEGVVYLTLYNPNYVGFYTVLTIPILTALFIFSKNWFLKIISIVLNSVIFLCLMGSGAKNGMVALLCALICMLFLFRKSLKTKWLSFAIAYASMIAIFFLFNVINGGMVTERLEAGFTVKKDTGDKLEKIETNEDNVVIGYDGNELLITMEKSEESIGVTLRDQNNAEIEMKMLEGEVNTYQVEDKRFPFEVSIGKVGGVYGFAVEIEEKIWAFSNQTGYKGYYFYSPYGKFTKIEEAETAVFTNYSRLATGRGYIWARTIPLLKDYLIVGSGPDTFVVVFPQKDYVAASKLGYDKLTISKPHNLYLQIGTQTGVVSLIAYLAFNIMYLLESMKIYWKKKPDCFLEYMGMANMVAIIGYMISAIINDSTITVAPIYWCLMGIGLAINRMVKRERTEG